MPNSPIASRWSLASAAAISLLTFCMSAAPAQETADAAFLAVSPSIVLVEGDERTTGFVVGRDALSAYIMTAAHVLDESRWIDNEQKPATVDGKPNYRLSPGDFLTVHIPSTGTTVPAVIIGEPDFRGDVLLATIPAAVAPRVACLANNLVQNGFVGVATFGLDFLHAPIPNRSFGDSVVRHIGTATSMRVATPPALPSEFEFDINSDRGFSGAPIFAVSTGLVTGIVRRNASVISNEQTATMLAVAPQVLLQTVYPFFDQTSFPVLHVEPKWTKTPDLKTAGKLRLLRFDDVATDGSVPAVYANHERILMSELTNAFSQGQFTVDILEDDRQRSLPPKTPLVKLSSRLCRVNGQNAIGAVAVKRSLEKARTAGRLLYLRIALLDCNANVIESADMKPVATQGDGSLLSNASHNQPEDFQQALRAALASLAGPGHRRLQNFAIDGLPLDDGEYRGFYRLRSEQDRLWASGGWKAGAGYDRAKLSTEVELVGVTGYHRPISTLTAGALDALLTASGPIGIAVTRSDGASTKLYGADRCTMLWRRQQMISDGVYEFDSRPGVNVI